MDFERVRATFGVVVTDVIDLRDVAHVSWFGLPELAFGYRLGIVTAALATSISLDRYRTGDPLEPDQEAIALALTSQSAEVGDALIAASIRLTDDAGLERLWLYVVIASIAAAPERALPYGLTTAVADALMYWPDDVAAEWQPPRPRWFRSHDDTVRTFIARRLEESSNRYLSPRDNTAPFWPVFVFDDQLHPYIANDAVDLDGVHELVHHGEVRAAFDSRGRQLLLSPDSVSPCDVRLAEATGEDFRSLARTARRLHGPASAREHSGADASPASDTTTWTDDDLRDDLLRRFGR